MQPCILTLCLSSRALWICLFLVSVCGVLAFDHSWRACLCLMVVLLLGVAAAFEDLHDPDQHGPGP